MNTLNVKHLFLIFFSFLFTSTVSANTDIIGRCDSCTESQKRTLAEQSAVAYMTAAERASYGQIIKIINIADLKSDTLITFRVTSLRLPVGGGTPVYGHQTVLITSSSTVQSKFNNVIHAKSDLKNAIEGSVIPTSVIGHPWEFVNCAYCENNIQDYLRATTSGKVESLWLNIQVLALSFGVLQAGLPATYTISLQGGGKIIIDTSVSADMQLIVKIVKVIDADNNTVPNTSTNLKDMSIWIPNLEAGNSINIYIGSFGFNVPSGSVGIVTIEECTKDPSVHENVCD